MNTLFLLLGLSCEDLIHSWLQSWFILGFRFVVAIVTQYTMILRFLYCYLVFKIGTILPESIYYCPLHNHFLGLFFGLISERTFLPKVIILYHYLLLNTCLPGGDMVV
jgi:hypothetical protein